MDSPCCNFYCSANYKRKRTSLTTFPIGQDEWEGAMLALFGMKNVSFVA